MDIGNNWQGAYSRWTFDELKQYMLVAKEMLVPGTQQGVPLLDSELNENAEILLTMLRRFISRSFGNGTNNDGFKIVQSQVDPTNNFEIKGGDGTAAGAGYIFVDGWMAIITQDLEYLDQEGVSALTTPEGGAPRVDEVYIDLYLDEVGPGIDPDMIDPGIGFETSRRIKLNWSVRVAQGSAAPAPYVDGQNRAHWIYKLATLHRAAENQEITSDMISDERAEGRIGASLDDLLALFGVMNELFEQHIDQKHRLLQIKDEAYTATNGDVVWVDTTLAEIPITFPQFPSPGDKVFVGDYAGTFVENACRLIGNGSPIMGGAVGDDLLLTINHFSATFEYVDAIQGWRI